jgi:hypothetical protein
MQGIADGRINLIGKAAPIADEEEKAAAKQVYLAKHPNSFWWVRRGSSGLSAVRRFVWRLP